MAGISNALKDQFLNEKFRTAPATKLGTVYVSIDRVRPNDSGTGGTEITGTGYAREAIPSGDANWSAPAAGTGNQRFIQNVNAVDYGTAGSDWAAAGGNEAVGFSVWDALTGGTYLGGNTFPAPKVIQNGDPVRFAPGELDVILSGS